MQVATADRVLHHHLRDAPVLVFEIGTGDFLRLTALAAHLRGLQGHAQVHVDAAMATQVLAVQISQWLRVGGIARKGQTKRRQGLHGDNPGRERSGKVFALKRTQRGHFPKLNVTR